MLALTGEAIAHFQPNSLDDGVRFAGIPGGVLARLVVICATSSGAAGHQLHLQIKAV